MYEQLIFDKSAKQCREGEMVVFSTNAAGEGRDTGLSIGKQSELQSTPPTMYKKSTRNGSSEVEIATASEENRRKSL